MPVQLENTTLSLSEISRLREIVLQTSIILNTEIDPFTIENLNKSDWWQYENARQVLSQTLVAEGYAALPAFSISDINNNTLATVLVESVNESLLSGGSPILLVSTGAVETVDGDYQQFTHDGVYTVGGSLFIWIADVAPEDRKGEFVATFKMPDFAEVTQKLQFFIGDVEKSSVGDPLWDGNNILVFVNKVDDDVEVSLNRMVGAANQETVVVASAPIADDVVTITVSETSVSISVGVTTEQITFTSGFLPTSNNILVGSSSTVLLDVLPLSIKVE